MATPSQLLRVISEVTRLSHATIVDLDRRLVTNGLRSKSGRGLSAARMTARDAANLLTAILVSAQANSAVEAVEGYRLTRPAAPGRTYPWDASGLYDLEQLGAAHSFVEALEAIITSASRGALAALIKRIGIERAPRLEIFALSNATQGRIRMSGLPSRRTVEIEYLPVRRRDGRARPQGDLEQSRRITEQTIFAVSALLAQEDPND